MVGLGVAGEGVGRAAAHADHAVLRRTYASACADAGRPFGTPRSAKADEALESLRFTL